MHYLTNWQQVALLQLEKYVTVQSQTQQRFARCRTSLLGRTSKYDKLPYTTGYLSCTNQGLPEHI